MMRILLVMPTPFESGRLGLENTVWLSEPVALTAVGGAVSGEHEVEILDMRLEREEALAQRLAAWRPDIVGTTSMTTDAYQALAVLRTAKQIVPGALTVVGGHHPTLMPEAFDAPFVDVIVRGEGELTFQELVRRFARGDRDFSDVDGLQWRGADGQARREAPRAQTTSLDALPAPDRGLIARYQGRYFFTAARPMASIFTSRGCAYDCNFCAIWEFYDRRVRFLSAERIAERMQACEEPFIFLLDDNFLTNRGRLERLCDALERRGVRKHWMTQGRTDFVADHPELMRRLVKNGLVGLLSGYETNDDDSLAALRKRATWEKSVRANRLLAELGVLSTGIFMVRPDWTEAQFQALYDTINALEVAVPLVTVLTPLPGTALYRAMEDQLLTTDHRLFDLLHPVLTTRLPREQFYAELSRGVDALKPGIRRAILGFARRRPRFILRALPGVAWFYARAFRYQRVHRDPETFLRDEEGLLNGPGLGVAWHEVRYPSAEAPEPARRAS